VQPFERGGFALGGSGAGALGYTSRAVVAAVAVVLSACAIVPPRPDPPLVTLEAVRVIRVAESKADISLRLRLGNPNDFEVKIESITFDVTLDGRTAANGRSARIDTLPARGEASVDIAGRVEIGAIATALMALGSQLPVDYAIRGSATLPGGTVLQFSRKGQIPVAQFDRAFGPRPQ
jgi:LEA14-like dessication related protein